MRRSGIVGIYATIKRPLADVYYTTLSIVRAPMLD